MSTSIVRTKRLVIRRDVVYSRNALIKPTKKRLEEPVTGLLDLGYDIFFLIFQLLCESDANALSLSNRVIKRYFEDYIDGTRTMKTIGGTTSLYPHQREILKWIADSLQLNETSKLLCNAYMSAGKTIIGYEACFRTMEKQIKEIKELSKSERVPCYSLICVSPNVFPTWINQAKKHYPQFLKRDKKRIYFFHSTRKDRDEILVSMLDLFNDEIKRKHMEYFVSLEKVTKKIDLNGKIIVVSLQVKCFDILLEIARNSSFTVFDECHKLQTNLRMVSGYVNCASLFLSASLFTNKFIEISDTYTLKNNKPMPQLNFRFIFTQGQRSHIPNEVLDEIKKREDKYIFLITNHKASTGCEKIFPPGEITTSEKGKMRLASNRKRIYSYFKREVRSLEGIKRTGGIMCSSFKVISEGNNFNEFSTAYFIFPTLCKLKTIRQTVGRFYRQSNFHSVVNIIAVAGKRDQNWARCRLAAINSIKLDGLEAKSTESIKAILKFLEKRDIDVDTLTDVDFLCLFATQIETPKVEITHFDNLKPTLPLNILVRCMLL